MAKTVPIDVNIVDTLSSDLYALRLAPGSILVVRANDRHLSRDQVEALSRVVKRGVAKVTGDEGFPVLFTTDDLTLETLPEAEMRRLGWVRPGEQGEGDR